MDFLKVSSKSSPASVAGAIAGMVKDGVPVNMHGVGAGAVNQAIKAVAIARGFLIPTGVAIALPSADYVALVFARSGLGIKHGIALSNGVGVIDSDYRGELRVGLTNLSDTPYTVQPGDRIAQLAVMPVVQARLSPVQDLDQTDRGAGGFGSTGV